MQRLGKVVRLLALALSGGLLVLLRYILKTPQLLESVLPGEEHIYKWTHGNVYYKVLGEPDALPLVLLHAPGVGASAHEMRYIYADLARNYRIYALDLIGFGLSDSLDIDYSAATYVALYQDFLRTVVGRPAVLLASGLSCNYAVALANNMPEFCLHLYLLSPMTLFTPSKPRPWLQALTRFSLSGLFVYALLTPRIILRRVFAWQYSLNERRLSDDDLDYAFAAAHQLGAQYAALAFINGKLDLDVSLDSFSRPVSMIWGASALQRVYSLLPPYGKVLQVRTLPDNGRLVHEESPAEVVATILHTQASEKVSSQGTASASSADSSPDKEMSAQVLQDAKRPHASATQVENPEEGAASAEAVDETVEAYCLKCKQKRTIQHARRTVTKNGRNAVEGTCPICGTKIMRFVSA